MYLTLWLRRIHLWWTLPVEQHIVSQMKKQNKNKTVAHRFMGYSNKISALNPASWSAALDSKEHLWDVVERDIRILGTVNSEELT